MAGSTKFGNVTVSNFFRLVLPTLFVLGNVAGMAQPAGPQPDSSIRGWLSDEQCARGRASSGAFTGTNPRCAKECVAKGKKVVLIDPDRKMIFALANSSLAKKNVGDFVEINGQVDVTAKTVRIQSVKMVSRGAAACERPKLSE